MERSKIVKIILVSLVGLTCLLDIFTFFYGSLFEFEINPLFMFLKTKWGVVAAISVVITYKVLINLGMMYSLYKYEPKKTHIWAFILTYTALMIILVQAFGAYSNMNVTYKYEADPINVKPLPVEQTYSIINVATTVYYACTLINLLAFFCYERMFRTNNIRKSSQTYKP